MLFLVLSDYFSVVLPFPVSCCWCDALSATNEGVRAVMPLRTNPPQWDQPHRREAEAGGAGKCAFKLLSGHL